MRRIAPFLLLLVSCAAAGNGGTAQELRAAGLTMTDRGEVEQPFLSVKGRVYEVRGGDLQVYSYPTEAAAQADASKISPEGQIEGTMVHWMAPPHFYRRGDTLAIYVGNDAGTLSTLDRVLGPPFAHRK